jgi:RHS repeat-associated protein
MTDNITMTYDGSGRRVGIVESHGSTVLTSKTFVWCGSQLCEERNSTGSTVAKRFFGGGEQINGTNYYFTRDHLGSIREVVDGSGNVQDRFDYDPWGRQTQLSGSLSVDFGYASYYLNHSTGLYLTKFRAYDPEKGTWLSRDPLGESQGLALYEYVESVGKPSLNLYEYANNNPLRFTDVLGLCANSSSGGLQNFVVPSNSQFIDYNAPSETPDHASQGVYVGADISLLGVNASHELIGSNTVPDQTSLVPQVYGGDVFLHVGFNNSAMFGSMSQVVGSFGIAIGKRGGFVVDPNGASLGIGFGWPPLPISYSINPSVFNQ